MTLLSLFDYSGNWSKPFGDAGWDVIKWDIKFGDFMDINRLYNAEIALELFEDVDGIIIGLPCTDFCGSGARWWKKKDLNGETEFSMELLRQSLRLVDLFRPTDPEYDGTFFWALENPVGRLGSLAGLENPYYFDPYEFAGHLHLDEDDIDRLTELRLKRGIGISKEDAEFIIEKNAYTKKTGLWGQFNRHLKKRPVAPVMGSEWGSPLMRLGGKSLITKEIRSNTPLGFAEAFYQANKNYLFQENNNQIALDLFD